ncbi:MAG: adenylate kinase [Aquabacterium sp.]
MPIVLQARAVFLGAPGAGKGTQAKQVAGVASIAHISTGDMLRQQVAAGTALGAQAKGFMDAGKLVPDQVIIGMVQARISEPDAKSAWILDGFPRTLPQAEALDKSLSKATAVSHVIYFAVPEQALAARLTGRRTCSKCGAIWHVETKPTKRDGVCDLCGGATVQRSDDHPDKIQKRQEEYRTATAPLLTYYRNRKLLREIDANRSPAVIQKELLQLMQ